MNYREIALWVDERWYQALSQQLENKTVEDKLNEYLNKLIDQLPEQVREKINSEIWAEDQRREQEIEASRKFSAFRITEHGVTEHFRVERSVKMLATAGYLRARLRQELEPRPFRDMLHSREEISADEFDRMTASCMKKDSRVTDVYDVDFDKREFSAIRSDCGWVSYRLKDISTAAWHAHRTGSYDRDRREFRFMSKLADREITSAGHLSARDISLAEEICEMDGQRLNFYVETSFDVDAVFGTHVCTAENDDSLNVYVDYDMAAGQVCDMLEVDLHRADGREESLEYRLNAVEKEMFLRKMDAHCQQQTGMSLKDYSAQRLAEWAQETSSIQEQGEQNHGPEMAM